MNLAHHIKKVMRMKNDDLIEITNTVQVLTLEAGKTNNTFAFNTGNGYLYAASSSSNYLKTESTLSANSSFTISITNNIANVVAQGTNTKNILKYNSSSSSTVCDLYDKHSSFLGQSLQRAAKDFEGFP